MARRSAISVRVDDDGKLTADGETDLSDEEWAVAWDAEIARRVKDVLEGRARRIPLERAIGRIRGAARGTR